MADVTISSLTKGIPSGNSIIPYSSGSSTLGVPVSAVLQNAGYVGIGTSGSAINAPGPCLHVKTTTGANLILEKSSGAGLAFMSDSNTPRALIQGINNSDGISFHYGSNYTEALRINSLGNIGIGTSTPQVKLDVNGTINGTQFGESGTWTPILRSHSDNTNTDPLAFTTSTNSQYTANYWKIGTFVYFNCMFNVGPIGGHVLKYISGLPFTVKSLGTNNNDTFANVTWPYIKGYPCSLGHCRGINFRWGTISYDTAPAGSLPVNNFTLAAVVNDTPGWIAGNTSPFIYLAASSSKSPFFGFWNVSGAVDNTGGGQYVNISGFYPTS